MNIIKKIILSIKNMFTKQDKVKKLADPEIIVKEDTKGNFVESLKVTTPPPTAKNKVETLTCEGDGLGIQKKISY